MKAEKLIDIIEMAGYETRTYSGRGMYGKQCVGFVVSSDGIIEAVAEIMIDEDVETQRQLLGLFRTAQTDSMGMNTIVYFPRLTTTA